MSIQKSKERESKRRKARYGMRGQGIGSDRRPEPVKTDAGLPRRIVRRNMGG